MATPGGEQGSSGSDGGDSDLIAVYEFCAAEYHWGPEYIEAWITDSQLVAYIDRARARRTKQGVAEIDRITLGVNTGTLITWNDAALRRWQSRRRGPQSSTEFTSTVHRLASMFPGKVH
jgi:hypothetical protein